MYLRHDDARLEFANRTFDSIKSYNLKRGIEICFASELAECLGYSSNHNYNHFRETTLKNARKFCNKDAADSEFHKTKIKNPSGQMRVDYELTKYACVLVCMVSGYNKETPLYTRKCIASSMKEQ